MKKYLLGLCIGTSGAKALVTSSTGEVIKSAEVTYGVSSPHPGWTEQDPIVWFNSAFSVIKKVLSTSNINTKNIISLGISGQMHSVVLLDKHNNVIRPAILWNDQRTYNECEYVKKSIGLERLLLLTSNKPISSFSLPKILWLRKNENENYKRLSKFCLSKDYIRFRFSNGIFTDPTDASGTLCYDLQNAEWSKELFNELNLDLSILPDIKPSCEFSASLSKEIAEGLGLKSGLPILTGTGDAVGEMVGNGILNDGDYQIVLGTGGAVLAYNSSYYKNDGSVDMFSFCDGNYLKVGVTLAASASLIWALKLLGIDMRSVEEGANRDIKYFDLIEYVNKNKFNLLEEQVKKIPVGCDGLIFLPYLTGERAPFADPYAKGVFFGLNLNHNKNHLLRAVMEGVAFAQRDCFEVVKKNKFDIKKIVISGGGAKDSTWCQIYSDIFNSKIVKMSTEEGPSLGMCILGAVTAGYYNSIKNACKSFLKVERIYDPLKENAVKYNELFLIFKKLYPNMKKSFLDISNFLKNN